MRKQTLCESSLKHLKMKRDKEIVIDIMRSRWFESDVIRSSCFLCICNGGWEVLKAEVKSIC